MSLTGKDDYPLPLPKVLGAGFHHHAGNLVAGAARRLWELLLGDDAESVADVAAAHRSPLQLDQAFAVGRGGDLHVDELEVLWSRQSGCSHRITRPPGSNPPTILMPVKSYGKLASRPGPPPLWLL